MAAQFDGAEILDGEYSQAAGNEFTPEMSADIFFGVGNHLLARPGNSAGVVIKLDIRCEITSVLFQLTRGAAIVECGEYFSIECRHRFEQGVLGRGEASDAHQHGSQHRQRRERQDFKG